MRLVTPAFWAIHERRSAKMLNSLGADGKPKGIQWSIYVRKCYPSISLLEDVGLLGVPVAAKRGFDINFC